MVLAREEEILGLLTLSSIVRGAFQSAYLGYWIDQGAQGSGIMAAAVRCVRPQTSPKMFSACTALKQRPWCTTLHRNGFWRRTGSSRTERPVLTWE
jgi:hypothetical protein